jgi:hypothetical protein
MEQRSLFPESVLPVSDGEVEAVLRAAICSGGRLSRLADLYLSAVCARHLVDELQSAGLRVVRPQQRHLRE